jgi:diguanylate cyclase (GGDEF)-like protein
MRLYGKIVLVALLPLLLALGLGFFRLGSILRFQQMSHRNEENMKMTLLNSRFEALREERRKYAAILAGASDAARAVEAGDTGFLLRWGELFLNPVTLSVIFFTDGDGTVLARSHDPYRFGDTLKDHPAFAPVLRGETVTDVFELDGMILTLHGTPVKLYGDVQVGAAVVGAEVTPELLEFLAKGTGLGMELKFEGFPPVATGNCSGERRFVSLLSGDAKAEPSGSGVEYARVFFEEDPLGENLLIFQRNLGLVMFLLFILLTSGLFLLLRRYLRPFSLLVEDVTLLSGSQEDLFRLRKKLEKDYRYANHEVSVIAEALSRLMEHVQETITLLEWTSRTDRLTRISNRLHLDSVLETSILEARAKEEPLSVVLFDLDHFKQVNDDFGHQAGDRVLQRTAEILKLFVPTGFVGRWGGEEFLAILPGLAASEAVAFGERIREAIREQRFLPDRIVTISAGVVEMASGDTPDLLVGRADKALYEAKATGRNKVVFRKA